MKKYSGSKLGKIPWIIKVTLILPVYIIAQKSGHTLKKIMQCSPAYRGTISYVFRIGPDHNRGRL